MQKIAMGFDGLILLTHIRKRMGECALENYWTKSKNWKL
jgi:hypothetical protein